MRCFKKLGISGFEQTYAFSYTDYSCICCLAIYLFCPQRLEGRKHLKLSILYPLCFSLPLVLSLSGDGEKSDISKDWLVKFWFWKLCMWALNLWLKHFFCFCLLHYSVEFIYCLWYCMVSDMSNLVYYMFMLGLSAMLFEYTIGTCLL